MARLTEAGPTDRYWRADAVRVLQPSPDRVPVRCPVAGPGGCGGCDWQHASLPAQRRLKAEVLGEQLRRLGRIDPPEVVVEPVPGDVDGLGWRTRVRFAVDHQGRLGFRRHRSHEVQPVQHCPIAHPRVTEVAVTDRRWPRVSSVEVVAPAEGPDRLVVVESDRRLGVGDLPPLAGEAALALRETQAGTEDLRRLRGRTWVGETVPLAQGARRFRVTGSGFWQVHPGAAAALVDAVLAAADPRGGEHALDLYCGVGLFASALAQRVGPDGSVLAVEAEGRAVSDARRTLHDLPVVRIEAGRVERVLPRLCGPGRPVPSADVVVLDPPRSGAGRVVLERVVALAPRVVVYVACDPAALARDVAVLGGHGYRLSGLRALDLFPMTHHLECVARFTPTAT
jgi:tRNA/tmRNA/rRNA uracil-C5-methylase (TrmA/RlmC/RlmD family)